MKEPNSVWDRAPTDAELNQFYGKEKRHETYDDMVDTIVNKSRIIGVKNTGLECVSHVNGYYLGKSTLYPLTEIISDYSSDRAPMKALIEMFEKSSCPLVQAYREALARKYAESWADEVDEFNGED